MGQEIRDLTKRGFKNRVINESLKAAMDLILKNRELKKQNDENERLEKFGSLPISSIEDDENDEPKLDPIP